METLHLRQRRHISRDADQFGFSLIELLVVIAIISILAAIIFPVFSTIREGARQSNTMEHMHEISTALYQYKLDNKNYPPVLFAYACNNKNGPDATHGADGCSVTDTMASIGGDVKATNELVGLYPEYVKDWQTFTCIDNTVDDPNGTTVTAVGANTYPHPVELSATDGTISLDYNKNFFAKDAMDISPLIDTVSTGHLKTDTPLPFQYMLRYSTNWTPLCDTTYVFDYSDPSNPPKAPCDEDYLRQLRWKNPPANTYVTSITYHVPTQNKILVLFESGTVKKRDVQTGLDPTNIDESHYGFDDPTDNTTLPTSASTLMECGIMPNGTPKHDACLTVLANFWKYTGETDTRPKP